MDCYEHPTRVTAETRQSTPGANHQLKPEDGGLPLQTTRHNGYQDPERNKGALRGAVVTRGPPRRHSLEDPAPANINPNRRPRGLQTNKMVQKKRAAKKAARAKGVWDQWYERNRPPQPRAYYPTAPPEYYPSAPPCQPFPDDYPEWGMAQNRQMTGRWTQWTREEEGGAARRGRAGNAWPRPQQALPQPGAPHPPHTQPGEGYPGSAPPGTGGATGYHHRDTNEEGQDEMDKTLSQAVIKQEH